MGDLSGSYGRHALAKFTSSFTNSSLLKLWGTGNPRFIFGHACRGNCMGEWMDVGGSGDLGIFLSFRRDLVLGTDSGAWHEV